MVRLLCYDVVLFFTYELIQIFNLVNKIEDYNRLEFAINIIAMVVIGEFLRKRILQKYQKQLASWQIVK